MPNLCNNFVTIRGDRAELDSVANILQAHKERRDTGLKCESPRWQIDTIEREGNIIMVHGPSAWVPPHDMLTEISSKLDVSIRNEYDEIGVNFAGHTYYERGYDFDFNLQFYEYFFFNNIDEFQAQLEILIMTMKPESTFEDLKEILLNGWENTPDSSALQTMEQMYNRSKQNFFQ